MKKLLIISTIIIIIMSFTKEEKVRIPHNSIRFRIIANSNSNVDQSTKKKLKNSLIQELIKFQQENNIKDTRKIIKAELPQLTKIVEKQLNSDDFHINYGKNFFPEKEYKGVYYPEGNYESLVITIGEGAGENFWCVLFPPLCLIDKDTQNVEYKSAVKEILDKYF